MKQLFLHLIIVAFLFTSCEEDSGSVNVPSSANVTLKYEVESPSAFTAFNSLPPLRVSYSNETGILQSEEIQINTNTTTWSKTIQLTATQRPIIIQFTAAAFTVNASGTAVVRLYVNGDLKAFQNVQIQPYAVPTVSYFTGSLYHFIY